MQSLDGTIKKKEVNMVVSLKFGQIYIRQLSNYLMAYHIFVLIYFKIKSNFE